MAAGLSIKQADFAAFQQAFEAVTRSLLNEADLQAVMETDGHLASIDTSLQTACILSSQVWGQGFPQPVFCDNFKVISQRIVGQKHLKIILEKDQKRIDAIYFNCQDSLNLEIRAAYALESNEYNNLQTVQLVIKYIDAYDETRTGIS